MLQHNEQLKQYYNGLALVDRRYRELQDSRAELLWYESKLAEANGLAVQQSLSKPSSVQENFAVIELNRDRLLNIFEAFQEELKRLQSYNGNFPHQLSNLQKNYEADLQSLRNRQEELEKDRKETLRLLESAKMAVSLCLLVVAGITVLGAYIFRDLSSTGIAALVVIFCVAIVPIFYSHTLVTAISGITRSSKKYQELDREIKKFRKYALDEEDRLLHEKRSKEAHLRAELENLRQEACNHLGKIRALTLYARHDANNVKPQNLRDEWNRQYLILSNIFEELARPVSGWEDHSWQEEYTSPTSNSPCSLFRIGNLFIEREQGEATVPAILTLRAHNQSAQRHWSGHVAIFSNDGDSRQAALQSMESLAVRTIASIPARSCKGIFIDPVNAGNTFPFRNFPNDIVGKQTYTRSEDIREQLRALAQHVEQVIQNYLSRNYDMIEEYNSDSAAIAEAYRYVFIADFPSGLDHSAIDDLKSLLLNGARAGVYVVLHIDDTLEKPRDFRYDLFEEWCTVLRPAYGLTTGGSFRRAGSFKVGYVYLGQVTRILHSGAFVEFLPGKEGMLPTAQMTERRIRVPEEAVAVGQILAVKVNSIDSQDRATLTCLGIQGDEAISAECLALQTEDFQHEGIPLFTLQLPGGEAFRIRLDTPPDSKAFRQITAKVSEAAQNVPTDVISFDRLYPNQLWAKDSIRNLSAPIGMEGARDKLEFLVGMNADGSHEPAHALLAGTTGSGKSYTLHAIIFSLALHYSPDELELYLLDYKEGVEFQVYVTPDRTDNPNALNDPDPARMLPHAQVISIESDAEFGLSVLERAIAEIEARGKAFKSVGAPSLESYRKSTGKVLPRLLIVIDEYQQMYLQADSRLCERLNDALETITKQGRSFGVHLLLGSQSPRVKDFRERIYENMQVRMAMKMSRSTASILMAEGNVDVVELLDRTGKLAYNDRLGEKTSNRICQVAFIDSPARLAAMQAILNNSHEQNYQRPTPTVIFNGIQSAQLKHNNELKALTQCDQWLTSKELNQQYFQEKDWISLENPCATWFGESMRIGRQVRAIFRRRPRNNLLLVGSAESEIFGILGGMLIGLAHTCSPNEISFQIADLVLSEGEVAEVMPTFQESFSKNFEVSLGKRFADNDREIVRAEGIWHQVVEEFDRRQAIRQVDTDSMNFGKSLFFVFALGNLSQIDRFRPIVGRTSDEMSPDAKKLLEVASKGSELGIHLILWLSDFKAFQQLFGGNRSALAHFDLRVALKMNDRDSQDFLGESIAKNLRDSQAYFTDASKPDVPEKFRPYAVLSPTIVESYAYVLKQRK
jgi:DNA segregation ATPase FtsK/SpoIIIE, S-DNA-T family